MYMNVCSHDSNVLSSSPKKCAISLFGFSGFRFLYNLDKEPKEVISNIIQLGGNGSEYFFLKALMKISSLRFNSPVNFLSKSLKACCSLKLTGSVCQNVPWPRDKIYAIFALTAISIFSNSFKTKALSLQSNLYNSNALSNDTLAMG